MQGKKAIITSSDVIVSKTLPPPYIRFFNLGKQVYQVICFAVIILNVVVVCLISKFAELILECAALLEKAMDFAVNFHSSFSLSVSFSE